MFTEHLGTNFRNWLLNSQHRLNATHFAALIKHTPQFITDPMEPYIVSDRIFKNRGLTSFRTEEQALGLCTCCRVWSWCKSCKKIRINFSFILKSRALARWTLCRWARLPSAKSTSSSVELPKSNIIATETRLEKLNHRVYWCLARLVGSSNRSYSLIHECGGFFYWTTYTKKSAVGFCFAFAVCWCLPGSVAKLRKIGANFGLFVIPLG